MPGAASHRWERRTGNWECGVKEGKLKTGDEDGGGREAKFAEGFDEHVRLVARIDDEAGLALHDDEAVGLQRAEREREDFERFSHLYLG